MFLNKLWYVHIMELYAVPFFFFFFNEVAQVHKDLQGY